MSDLKKVCYYYYQLPKPGQKALYREILKTIQKQQTDTLLHCVFLEDDDINQVLQALDWDYPELCYVKFLGEGVKYWMYKNGDRKVRICYRYCPEEQKKKLQETENLLQYLLSHIPDKVAASPYLTAVWLHDLTAQNIRYDHPAAEKGSSEFPDAFTITGNIRNKTAVCSGIARFYMMLCERMDIWCTYVRGECHPKKEGEKPEKHAWNLVYINGVCAYVDVTWDLWAEETDRPTRAYLGIGDRLLANSRKVDLLYPSFRVPPCPDPSPLNYYCYTGNFFTDKKQLKEYLIGCIRKKKTEIAYVYYDADRPLEAYKEEIYQFARDTIVHHGGFRRMHNYCPGKVPEYRHYVEY